jgi:hypothetical protein
MSSSAFSSEVRLFNKWYVYTQRKQQQTIDNPNNINNKTTVSNRESRMHQYNHIPQRNRIKAHEVAVSMISISSLIRHRGLSYNREEMCTIGDRDLMSLSEIRICIGLLVSSTALYPV